MEEWTRVWYHKPDSYWKEARAGTWCHVKKYGSRVFCKEYDEARRRGETKPASSSYLAPDCVDWEKKEEVNEFGPVTP